MLLFSLESITRWAFSLSCFNHPVFRREEHLHYHLITSSWPQLLPEDTKLTTCKSDATPVCTARRSFQAQSDYRTVYLQIPATSHLTASSWSCRRLASSDNAQSFYLTALQDFISWRKLTYSHSMEFLSTWPAPAAQYYSTSEFALVSADEDEVFEILFNRTSQTLSMPDTVSGVISAAFIGRWNAERLSASGPFVPAPYTPFETSVGLWCLSRSLAVSLQVSEAINPTVGCQGLI